MALKYYNKACKLGDEWGCEKVGDIYYYGIGVEKNDKLALDYYNKGCDSFNDRSCYKYKKVKIYPKPFGLKLGYSTKSEFSTILKKKNWVIKTKGYKIIKDNISSPNVYGYFIENINLKNLKIAKFWFYKDTLMQITYILYDDMNKSTFKSYYDKLKAKYGKPDKYTEPHLADGYAEWNFMDIKIKLICPWTSKYAYLIYENDYLVKLADKDDQKYYQDYIKKTSKDIEGL